MYNITENDYEFLEEGELSYHVKLKTGPYAGTVVQYGKVTAHVNEDNETATLSFDYELIEGDDILEHNTDFNKRIGAVLEHIIQSAFDSGKYKLGNEDEHTNTTDNDTKEPSK